MTERAFMLDVSGGGPRFKEQLEAAGYHFADVGPLPPIEVLLLNVCQQLLDAIIELRRSND